MADETEMVNGEVTGDQTVNIAGDDSSESELKGRQLLEKIAALEKEKEVATERIEKLKQSANQSSAENEDLKEEVERLGAENKVLQSVAARAAELEAEVSRLQHDLISAMSDLEESKKEVLEWKLKAQDLEDGARGRLVEFEAIRNERDLLIKKLETFEARDDEKGEVIRGMEKEFEVLKGVAREFEEAKGIQKELLEKIGVLDAKVKEKEEIISEWEAKGMAIEGAVNGKAVIVEEKDSGSVALDGRKRENLIGGLKVEWPVVAGSAVSAVALAGVVCYLHAKKRLIE